MDTLTVIIVLVVSYLLFHLYMKSIKKQFTSDVSMAGKTVLITGGSSGIGFETALELAKRAARVIIASRDPTKGEEAVYKIISQTLNPNVFFQALDLSSLQAIRHFVENFNRAEPRLDILVNNAGIISPSSKKMLTVDGLEKTMATNHFGPFLLTNLLLDKLQACAPTRVVVVSSVMQKLGKIEFENLNFEKTDKTNSAYGNSKLANILFVKELHRQYHHRGISAFALHPGTVQTDLLKTLDQPLNFLLNKFIMPLFFRSAKEGAQTTLYCCAQPDIEHLSGKYFMECQVADEGAKARDDATARKLWEISETITGLA